MKYNFSSQKNNYLTPAAFYEKVLEEAGLNIFDCDVCCSEFNIPAKLYYKPEGLYSLNGVKLSDKDGLSGTWFRTNWCNPPFNITDKFVYKALEEQKKGHTTYMLLPARTETNYWYDGILEKGKATRENIEITFLKKGLSFIDPNTGEPVKMHIKQKNGTYKEIDGAYKDALALVIFRGINND